MKEIEAAVFKLVLDAEPLPGVEQPEALLQFMEHAPIDRKAGRMLRRLG
jgi:hypothetical protein